MVIVNFKAATSRYFEFARVDKHEGGKNKGWRRLTRIANDELEKFI